MYCHIFNLFISMSANPGNLEIAVKIIYMNINTFLIQLEKSPPPPKTKIIIMYENSNKKLLKNHFEGWRHEET